ncbi:MAG: DUF4340 domain-containing protein [Planctomycetia bacterium]|nr:DUF4340 domain-containing protein [Planctomycetia bacterium]
MKKEKRKPGLTPGAGAKGSKRGNDRGNEGGCEPGVVGTATRGTRGTSAAASESRSWKTSCLLGLLALALLFLWLKTIPHLPDAAPNAAVGQKLLSQFSSPLDVYEFTIKRVAESGQEEAIHLVRRGDVWTLADYYNYEANHPNRLPQALATLLGLTVLDVVEELSENADAVAVDAFHRQCGLLMPELPLASGDEGHTGTLVRVLNEEGDAIAALLIGCEPAESSPTRRLRYVRVPNQDTVYIVDFSAVANADAHGEQAIDVDALFSTRKMDWLDRDFLHLSRWNILHLVETRSEPDAAGTGVKLTQRVVYEQDATSAMDRVWTQVKASVLDANGKPEEQGALAAEETDNGHVNGLVEKLCRLRLVAVARKPSDVIPVFEQNRPFAELSPLAESLAAEGFCLLDHDPFDAASFLPLLTGVGGHCSLILKDHVCLNLLTGKTDSGGTRLLVYASFDPGYPAGPELVPKAGPGEYPDAGALEKENARRMEENRIRTSEFELQKSQGQKAVESWNRRLAPWLYYVEEEATGPDVTH